MKLVPSTMKMTSESAGQVRAAGDAAPHHRAHLGNVEVASHDRVVVEDARGAVLPGEDAALIRKVHAGAVHQVDDGDPLAHRDFLRAQNLPDRLGPPRAGLHGGVVRHDHDFATLDHTDAGDDAGRRGLAVVLVVRDQQTELEPRRAGIEQTLHPFSGRELPLLVHLGDARGAAAFLELGGEPPVLLGQGPKPRGLDAGADALMRDRDWDVVASG